MYCFKCGTKLDDGVKFCSNCGEMVQIQNDRNDNIQNVILSQQNSKKKVNITFDKIFNILNYKTVYEKILLLVNVLLCGALTYCFLLGLGWLFISIVFDFIFMVFIVMFGGEPFAITKIALTDLENITIYFVIVMMISTVFNAIMYFLMSKEKNIDEKFSFKVNKIKYLLTSYFLGYCGIHRFIAKDKQGGKFRLILIGTVGLTFFIAIAFQFDIMMYLGIMMLACVLGLDTSDFVIALTKKADNEGNIFV